MTKHGTHALCAHNKKRVFCKLCKALGLGGGAICDHNRERSSCKECGGGRVCEHSRIRSQCKECRGTTICEHNRLRPQCKDCKRLGIGGKSICEHRINRSRCLICRPEGAYKIYRRAAQIREIAFNVTLEEFKQIISTPCVYCGESLKARGIDRRDNGVGYETSNCFSCCKKCNHFKWNLSVEDFIEHCRQIVVYYGATNS